MVNRKSSTSAPALTLPVFSKDDLQREAEKHDVLPCTVLKRLCGLEVAGRAGERAERAAAALRSLGR